MKKLKGLLLVVVFFIFLFSVSCSHEKVMRDYYKTKRQSELAKMAALRSFVRSNQTMRQANLAMMKSSTKDAGIIALSNAIMSMNESRAIETALTTWYGQRIEQPRSETADIISSMGWIATPLGIVAGGWALGYVLNNSGNGGNITNNTNSYNKTESDNQLNGSHRNVSFTPNDNSNISDVNLSQDYQPSFSPYSPGSSDSIFSSFDPTADILSPGTTQ